jgi:hypothetical protein
MPGRESARRPIVNTRYARIVTRTALAVIALSLALLTGCSPQPTATSDAPDFTQPGVAEAMVKQLITEAGSDRVLMVEVKATTVQVSVLKDKRAVTWAYRNGETGKAASDLTYVDQATFDVTKFNISDVGALFRAAAGQSGSSSSQSLSIVDYSAGEVMITVSTQPESSTVFFNPDGSLLEVLDFDTQGGIARGISETTSGHPNLTALTVTSDQSVQADYPGANGTTVRITRAPRVPPISNVRSGADLPEFPTGKVNAAAIWQVVTAIRGQSEVASHAKWSVTIDNREKLSQPRMYFTFGFKVVTTDLDGNVISQ